MALDIEQTRAVIAFQLRSMGSAFTPIPEDLSEMEIWRKVARSAAHGLGRRVQTSILNDGVHAWLTDWPRDRREEKLRAESMRRSVHAATLTDSNPSAPRHSANTGGSEPRPPSRFQSRRAGP